MTEARSTLRDAFMGAVGKLGAEDAESCGPPVRTFHVVGLPGMRFELRPATVAPPPSASVSLMYRRDEGGNYNQAGVAFYKDGAWKRQGKKPLEGDLYWTLMVSERG